LSIVRNTFSVLIAFSILTSTALAGTKCNVNSVTGSYIRQHVATPGYMDQLRLSVDGGAYYYSSAAFDLLITGGTLIPSVGSWTCQADGSVLVTTIGSQYGPNGSGDITITVNERRTFKLLVVNGNTLQPANIVVTTTDLTGDPFGSGTVSSCGGSSGILCDAANYKRVVPQASDLN